MIEAFRFHQRIGRKRVAERIHALNEQCKEGLAKMRHVKLYTPWGSTLSAGLICFDVNGMQPKAVVKKLLQHKIVASTTPYGSLCNNRRSRCNGNHRTTPNIVHAGKM